jgi:hypothetical protein
MSQTNKQFDPSKKYTWDENTKFTLSGGEFGMVLNTLRAILSTREAAHILMANEAHSILENSLAQAVQNGDVQEQIEENGNN